MRGGRSIYKKVPEPQPTEGIGEVYALALLDDSETLRAHPEVYPLGFRIKRSGKRDYYLDAFDYRPRDSRPFETFYVLRGGVSDARTVLDSTGTPIVDDRPTNSRGLSREFRDWITRAVEIDRQQLGRVADE